MRGYFVIVGIALAVWQIVAVRELFPLLHSCEPLIVASLGVAALFLALGVLLGPSAEVPMRRRVGPFSVLLWIAGLLPPFQLAVLRRGDGMISSFPPSLAKTLLLCAMAVGPLAADAGLLLTVFGAGGEKAQGRMIEAILFLGSGAAIGGVGFLVFLADVSPPLLTALCLALFLFTAILLMFGRRETPGILLVPAVLSWIAVIAAIVVAYSPIWKLFCKEPEKRPMPSVTSAQGRLDAALKEGWVDVRLNRESITPRAGIGEVGHIPMLEHPMPHTALVIGGCGPDLVGEVARHHLDSLRYFHVDPAAIALMQRYSPDSEAFRSDAVGLQVPLEEIRAYVQERKEQFDVVIMDLPLPRSAGMNRLLTREFFSALRGVVKENGFAALAVHLPDNASEEMHRLAGSILMAFTDAFPEYVVTIGKVRLLIGCVSGVGPTMDPNVLLSRCRERGLGREEFGRPEFRRGEPPQTTGGANSDFQPRPYRQCFNSWLGIRTEYLSLANTAIIAGLAAVVIGALGWMANRRHVAAACAGTVFTGGAAGLLFSSELLALQAIYGCLYRQVAFMVAVLAIGLCAGQAVSAALNTGRRDRYVALAGASGALMILSLLFPAVLGRIAVQSNTTWWLLNLRITLPFLGGLAGFLAAFSFGTGGPMIGLPEALFMALVSAGLGLMAGAVVLAPGIGITFPCDVSVVLCAAGTGVVVISMQGTIGNG